MSLCSTAEVVNSKWEEENRGRQCFGIKPCINRKRKVNLGRSVEVKLTRLLLWNCGLGSGMAVIKKHQDGKCEGCGEVETVTRVLLHCKRCEEERRTLFGLPLLSSALDKGAI